MGQPVLHFEVIGRDPANLRTYYNDLFGWEFEQPGDRPRTRTTTATSIKSWIAVCSDSKVSSLCLESKPALGGRPPF
jgi:hypothetical protein